MIIFFVILFTCAMMAGMLFIYRGILLCKNLYTAYIGLIQIILGVFTVVTMAANLAKLLPMLR